MNRPCQPVALDVIESQELPCPGQVPIGRPESLGVSHSFPVLPVEGLEFQRAPFVIAQNSAAPGCLMIKSENAVFFLELRI